MKASDNADPKACLFNLLSTIKTECPMSRGKGLDARLIDRPANNIEELDAEITDLVKEYEGRLDESETRLEISEQGDFNILLDAGDKEEL